MPNEYSCEVEGCQNNASQGARYCQGHWRDGLCALRECEAWARSGSFLCERHDAELRSFGRIPLFEWLLARDQAPLGPSTVPGLGSTITTHGLPTGEDTAALEAALLEAGVPRFSTPSTLRVDKPRLVPPPPPAPPPGRFVLLSPNRYRFSALVHNEGPAELCIEIGASQLFLPAGQIWQPPSVWLGTVFGFWCGPEGAVRVTDVNIDRTAVVAIYLAD